MVRPALAISLLALTMTGQAQEPVPGSNNGLLRASATIAPGLMLHEPVTNIYVGGRLEYFPEERISFRGEGFWYVDSQQENAPLAQNSQIAFGPFYHLGKDRVDLAFGIEPGISLSQPATVVLQEETVPLRASPSIALCASLTYTVWDHMHFFVDVRYVHASYRGAPGGSIPLDEIVAGGGLGWHLNLRD